jgi:hypothetical protein
MFNQCSPASRKLLHIANQLLSALLSDRINAARSATRLKFRRVTVGETLLRAEAVWAELTR